MKRLTLKYNWLYFIALCASLLTACEPTQVSIDKDAIAFKNAPASPTAFEGNGNARLFAYTTTSTDATPFWVYGSASQGAPANLTNVDFEKRTATFAVKGETKYWADATYNFFSVYSETLDDETPTFEPTFNAEENKFTFSYSVADQQNELWAAYLLNEPSHITTNEEVDLEFNHILSKINFNVNKHSHNTNDNIIVNYVSISNVYASGRYSLDVNNAISTWTSTQGDIIKAFSYGKGENEVIGAIPPAGKRLLEDGFLIIPQKLTASMELTISYTFGDEETPRIARKNLPLAPYNAWEAGNRYIYNLILSPVSNDILFTTPTIETWEMSQVGGSIIVQ